MAMPRRKFVQNPADYQRLLQHLKTLRVGGGHSQKNVAEALNLSRSQYTSLEQGRSMLTVDQLIGLSKFYGVAVSRLTDGVL